MSGVQFGADASAAYGLMGYVTGVSEVVKTPVYINAVVRYTHARLSYFFDIWLDEIAKGKPEEWHHVYEWPTSWGDGKPNYAETVGHPHWRLWRHTFSGPASRAVASFQFEPSVRPSPVNPILTTAGPGGRAVKTGVHIFHLKAAAMEYAIPIKVTPDQARYLAYVIDGNPKGQGKDADKNRHPNAPEDEGGNVMLSKGPVTFKAGGGKFNRKFTSAFQLFYRTVAQNHMKNDILPYFEQDLIDTAELTRQVKVGVQNRNKLMNISAAASQNEARFREAKLAATKDLKEKAQKYRAAGRTNGGGTVLYD